MTTSDAQIVNKFGIENSIRIHQSLPDAINAFYNQVKNVIAQGGIIVWRAGGLT